jgi:hypothetical protein
MIGRLAALSSSRVTGSQEYRERNAKIQKYREQFNSRAISLKEESTMEKQKQKELEKSLKKDDGKKLIDLENDLFLREALQIASDYMGMVMAAR